VRPSEQLGLLWEDVDLEAGVIRIRRMLERDGSISEFTKTAAGTREIPIAPLLKSMLLEWRVICPRRSGELHLVFPGQGWKGRNGRRNGGRTLVYANFRNRYWKPALGNLGLPYVAPHSARHVFISTLQAKGIEVGLVAKLAGHANATVTLTHYTQAVRGGADAVSALEQAYTG
jgi:integrase